MTNSAGAECFFCLLGIIHTKLQNHLDSTSIQNVCCYAYDADPLWTHQVWSHSKPEKCKYGKDEPDSLSPDAMAMLNDINASTVDTDNNLSSHANFLTSSMHPSNDDNGDYPAAQEEVDEPAGNLTGMTLHLQMLSDVFDFTSQGHNNNRFEHFQQAGKSNVMKEMETYETVGMQTWQEAEVDMELGSDLREFALEFM